jgi:hypothetical protein
VRALLRFALPAAVTALLLAFAGTPYAKVLAAATGAVRERVPPPKPITAVQVDGPVLVVRHPGGAGRVHAGGIAWSLPVLLCLWAWVVGRRWGWLAAAAAAFVVVHVLVAEVSIRAALGGAAGPPYAFARAWVHWLSGAAAVFAVALAWAAGRDPATTAVPPSRAPLDGPGDLR